MSFIATPPPQHSWAESPVANTILNDGWFPDVDSAAVRDTVRLNGTVTEIRLVESITAAIAGTNRELQAWRDNQMAAGHASLAAVPAQQAGGESVLLGYYRRAVYHAARADLLERYRDFDTTAAGDQLADELAGAIDEARRNSRWAVLDILGKPHLTVELI